VSCGTHSKGKIGGVNSKGVVTHAVKIDLKEKRSTSSNRRGNGRRIFDEATSRKKKSSILPTKVNTGRRSFRKARPREERDDRLEEGTRGGHRRRGGERGVGQVLLLSKKGGAQKGRGVISQMKKTKKNSISVNRTSTCGGTGRS